MNVDLGPNDLLLDLPDDLIDQLIVMAGQDRLSLEDEIKRIIDDAAMQPKLSELRRHTSMGPTAGS
ncbi:MAG TPA: hypothetical protein VJP07_01135 [Dehalococcoidia bacterium]|nr:hypothetical protein [Dehalococcoidia bacterium]